jgi:ketosteroid isomerase-like protein
MDPPTMEHLAERVRTALQSGDLTAYRELLDPNVRWGPLDDPSSGCTNRDEVLTWYRRGRARGVRAAVTETVVQGDTILVGLRVTGNPAEEPGGEVDRWQVLRVVDGRIVDIRGFDDRVEAARRLA